MDKNAMNIVTETANATATAGYAEVFPTLNKIDVSEWTKTKNNLSYLPWASAWGIVKEYFPDATFRVIKSDIGWNFHAANGYAWVEVGVTIRGVELIAQLAITDYRNNPIPLEKVTQTDSVNTCQRALAKACSLHGLGLQLWLGCEDAMDWSKGNTVDKTTVQPQSETVLPPKPKASAKATAQTATATAPQTATATPAPAAAETKPKVKIKIAKKTETEAPAPAEVTPTEATEKQATPVAKQFVSKKDGKLYIGDEVLDFSSKSGGRDLTECAQETFAIGGQVELKAYAGMPVGKAFGEMLKNRDEAAFKKAAQFIGLPMFSELPSDKQNLPCFDKLAPDMQVSLSAFASHVTNHLLTHKWTY